MNTYLNTIDEMEALVHSCARDGSFYSDKEYIETLGKLLDLRIFVENTLEDKLDDC